MATNLLLSSCISTKRISGIIKNNLLEIPEVNEICPNFVILNTDSLPKTDSVVTVKKEKSFLIPAVFFWAWNSTMQCEINNKYLTQVFESVLYDKIKVYNLEKFIGNRTLEISLKQIPNQFKYTNNGSLIFVLYFYSYNYQELVYRNEQKFALSYKYIAQDGTSRGNTLTYNFQPVYKNKGFTGYGFVNEYIRNLRFDFDRKSSDFIEQIIEDL